MKNSPCYLIMNCCHIVNARDLVSPLNQSSVTQGILLTQSNHSDLVKDYLYALQKTLFQTLWFPLNAFEFGVFLFCGQNYFV